MDDRSNRRQAEVTGRFADVVYSLLYRPGRTILSTFGIAFGVGALVGVVGISQTSASAVGAAFDALRATAVLVTPVDPSQMSLPLYAQDRVVPLNGVNVAYTMTQLQVTSSQSPQATVRMPDPGSAGVDIYAVSDDLWNVDGVRFLHGRGFDSGHSDRIDHVAVLGPAAATRLGIGRVTSAPGLALGDHTFVVAGIASTIPRHPELLNSVMIPLSTAVSLGWTTAPASLVIVTDLGAVDQIGQQAPTAVSPVRPNAMRVQTPLQPLRLRATVAASVDLLTVSVGAVTLLVSIFGIASMALASVLERSGEIGLRRALGASKSAIGFQFGAEFALIGLVGGLIGTALGYVAVVAVAAMRNWTPTIDSWVPLLGPVVGLTAGLLATIYPTLRAIRIDPSVALSSGVK